MILQRLCEAASRFDFPATGYQTRPVKWLVSLDAQGEFLGFVRTTSDETRRVDRGKEIAIPFVLRTSGVAAQLLADRADYTLGHAGRDPSEKEIKNALLRHGAFLDLLGWICRRESVPRGAGGSAVPGELCSRESSCRYGTPGPGNLPGRWEAACGRAGGAQILGCTRGCAQRIGSARRLSCLRPGFRHRKSPPSPHQARPWRADLGLRPSLGQCSRL